MRRRISSRRISVSLGAVMDTDSDSDIERATGRLVIHFGVLENVINLWVGVLHAKDKERTIAEEMPRMARHKIRYIERAKHLLQMSPEQDEKLCRFIINAAKMNKERVWAAHSVIDRTTHGILGMHVQVRTSVNKHYQKQSRRNIETAKVYESAQKCLNTAVYGIRLLGEVLSLPLDSIFDRIFSAKSE